MSKTCHMVLMHKWFDLIDKGLKKVEYRRLCDYWLKRLEDADRVTFHRGYTSQTMTFEIEHITLSDHIEIKLGKRLERR